MFLRNKGETDNLEDLEAHYLSDFEAGKFNLPSRPYLTLVSCSISTASSQNQTWQGLRRGCNQSRKIILNIFN